MIDRISVAMAVEPDALVAALLEPTTMDSLKQRFADDLVHAATQNDRVRELVQSVVKLRAKNPDANVGGLLRVLNSRNNDAQV